MAIVKRVGLGRALTHPEMDENFSSVYFSSSLENNASSLKLYYDTTPLTYDEIPLNAGGSIGITNYANNRLVTATSSPNIITGQTNFTYDGSVAAIKGRLSLVDTKNNILVGTNAGIGVFNISRFNTILGDYAGEVLSGISNTIVGCRGVEIALAANYTVAVGKSALAALGTGDSNVAIGTAAGQFLQIGTGNIYIGNGAGSNALISENNKLYINNTVGTPLIGGDFSAQTVSIAGALTVSQNVNAVSFTGSFQGDGSGLTGIASTGWDGIRNGNAQITGSLVVSESGAVVDFTNTTAISGSTFSGSFVGNGAGLTGVVGLWNGIRNGDVQITGSVVISGSSPLIDLKGVTTIDTNIRVWNPYSTSIGIGVSTFSMNASNQRGVALGYQAAQKSTASNVTAVGYSAGVFAGLDTVYVGDSAGYSQTGQANVIVGSKASSGANGSGTGNTIIGAQAGFTSTSNNSTVGIGASSLYSLISGNNNVAVGANSLRNINTGFQNVAVGNGTAYFVIGNSFGNVYIGDGAGPSSNVVQSGKLYINNQMGTPLIGGDFTAQTVTITGALTTTQRIVAPSFTGSFSGSGANLTNLPPTAWNGIRNGNAQITGSLVVSGSGAIVNLTSTSAISGSIFSGSFVGNGSGITGINIGAWDGIRNGNAQITGSLVVSGALQITNTFTISSGSVSSYPGVNIIHIATSSLSAASTTLYTFPLDATTGYTGFKADYTLTNSAETSKKVGTLLGSWDRSGNPIINDSHTLSIGDVNLTAFSIASNSTSASLNLGVTSGTFELNMLVTAFKRSI